MMGLSNQIIECRDIVDEVFGDYKYPSMLIAAKSCDWKCCIEAGVPITICQNHALINNPLIKITYERLYERYEKNPITSAIIFAGLEPMLQFEEVLGFISYVRNEKQCKDPIVIYTGYYEKEVKEKLEKLKPYENILVKFGRYIPNTNNVYDANLGVNLSSDNQVCKEIK